MKLDILTPEGTLFSGEVESVSLPGAAGMFTVLENHAPLYALLRENSAITYSADGREGSVAVWGGFVEVRDNRITACVGAVPADASRQGTGQDGSGGAN